jgi:DNA-binding beta-propeller fold protein YncE
MTVRHRCAVLLSAVTVWSTGCGAAEPGAAGVVHDTLTADRQLVSTESELVGSVTGMTVGDDGRVYVSDFALKHVLSVDGDGGDPVVVGREGSGPGEFSMPVAISAVSDSIRVYDMAHGTVQVFAKAGGYVRGFNTGAPQSAMGRAFARDGRFAFATGGIDSTLVRLINADGEPIRRIGEPIVPASTMWDFTAMKAAIREGRVPDQFRNDAVPLWLEDGSIVMAFNADPEVRRYDSSGDLVWSTPLADPVLDHAFAEFVRRNTEEPNPAMLYRLSYIRDALVAGSEIWLLLATGEDVPGVILALDADTGQVTRRRVVQGVSQPSRFALDTERSRLYVANGGDANIVIVDLEEQHE